MARVLTMPVLFFMLLGLAQAILVITVDPSRAVTPSLSSLVTVPLGWVFFWLPMGLMAALAFVIPGFDHVRPSEQYGAIVLAVAAPLLLLSSRHSLVIGWLTYACIMCIPLLGLSYLNRG